MTNLDELKKAIADSIGDKEVGSSLCCDIDAYAQRWPFIFTVKDWNIWNESKRALRLQVIRWLEEKQALYDFWQFRNGCGLIGFENLKVATHFTLRWSGHSPAISDLSTQEWNPHPLSSTFEASCADEVSPKTVARAPISRYGNRRRARNCGTKFFQGYGVEA
jgi:hypothetical protein